MKTVLFFLLSGSMLFFMACDKDPTKKGYQRKPPKPEFYRFRLGEAKEYLWAKKGSYWIYKQTGTGDLDTQVCTGLYYDSITITGSQDYNKHITIVYDRIARNISSGFNSWSYYDESVRSSPSGNNFRNWRVIIERQANGGIITNFHYPFNKDEISGTGAETTTFMGMDSVLVLQGKTYYDLAKFDVDNDALWELKYNCTRPNTVYYWAKGIGLVKKQMNRCGYSWELIEYNIIK